MLGLALIATGTGGIKPCVAAFGGDQVYVDLFIIILTLIYFFISPVIFYRIYDMDLYKDFEKCVGMPHQIGTIFSY